MALPTTINAATPAGGDSPIGGDNEIRAIKTFFIDLFGFDTDPTQITAQAFDISTAGLVTVSQYIAGILKIGTSVVTGAIAGDIVLGKTAGVQFLVDDESTSASHGMRSSGDDINFDAPGSMSFEVPGVSPAGFYFRVNGVAKFIIDQEEGAGVIELVGEVGAPVAAATANSCKIVCVDNGAGKTQLVAVFASGAAQQLAIQP